MVSLSYEYSDDAVMVQKDANGIGKKFSPLIYPAPHCSKANSYAFQRWTIQMRQAKSYLAFRCKIPKYIIHVILFAKGCISSTHYSCSYRSIISCCKWYRKYAYCYISRQTCRTSPLWLTPNYNPVNIIRLGYIRSIWLICTSCNSSIRCRTSRAAPFARSRCNCKEHVCKWYW